MAMTVAESAQILGVTPRQVQRLVSAAEIPAERGVGDSWMLDGGAVRERARLGVKRGRIWNQATAWAAIELVGTGSTNRLDGSVLSRLRRSLKTLNAQDFARQAQGRSRTVRMTQTRKRREALSQQLQLTGSAALSDPSLSKQFGLTPGGAKTLEGYLSESAWERVITQYGLIPDVDGDVLLHVTDVAPPRVTPVLVALDLYARGSTRELAAALSVLDQYLNVGVRPSCKVNH